MGKFFKKHGKGSDSNNGNSEDAASQGNASQDNLNSILTIEKTPAASSDLIARVGTDYWDCDPGMSIGGGHSHHHHNGMDQLIGSLDPEKTQRDAYNNALADFLENVKGKDEKTTRSAAAIVAKLVEEEPNKSSLGKHGYEQAIQDIKKEAATIERVAGTREDAIRKKEGDTGKKEEATAEHSAITGATGDVSKIADETLAKATGKDAAKDTAKGATPLSPTDRILNAMAGLAEDAKTSKNEDYKKSIAESTAQVVQGVASIKESEKEGRFVYKDYGAYNAHNELLVKTNVAAIPLSSKISER